MSFGIFIIINQIFLWENETYNNSNVKERESERHSVVSDSLWLHGILQARILEWIAFPFSRGSSQPRDGTQVSHIAGRFFTSWATREANNRNADTILKHFKIIYK